ncbi:MAG: hypothetical protein K6G84_10470 [Lachnospiraceae bacterium]|nr:hypothetical protein [Lachnospiraceae bacterium]
MNYAGVGPDLERFVKDEYRRNFISYADGARMYGMKYWPFVRLVKRAEANIAVRRSVVVDMDILDRYLEQFRCSKGKRRLVAFMAKDKKAPIGERIGVNGKKFVRPDEAAELYSVSRRTVEKWVEKCDAEYKLDGIVLYNIETLDKFIELVGKRKDKKK